ncbi:S-adenosyl-L-methionine-dependent methyltransferase [Xylariomycetidae sp. FL0641]|nr:S-adenosyl-L-methionine-dependent methyltransferase [Xylariomycetidae sp. FL0641]
MSEASASKGKAPAIEPAAASSPQPEPATTTTTTTTAATTSGTAASPGEGNGQGPTDNDILPPSHWAEAPLEDDEEYADSTYGESIASSTASLSASILEYRTLHGRTFHSERGNAQSWNPNDAQHDESMDMLHHVSTLQQDGKIFLAPLDESKIQKVLDVGCGTGIWAIDFADQFPSAEVIGVDISPQQPQWIPPNLKFEIDDVTQPWTYAPNSFDYVHMRWMVGAIPDWDALYKEAYRSIKPGGWLESNEASTRITSDDGTVAEGSALDQWGKVFSEAGTKFGRTFKVVDDDLQRRGMEAAGFVDIRTTEYKTPVGSWPADPKLKEIGQYQQLAMQQDAEGFVLYIWTTVMGWSKEEVQVYAAHLRRELRNKSIHAWYRMRILTGRKPMPGEVV